MLSNQRGGQVAGARPPPSAHPPPSWALCCSTDILLPPIYIHIPPNIQEHHGNLIPPPQPSVPERSHLGAFFGAPPKGALTTEGLYINSMASPVMCEQFISDLRVHSYQLDGFFSLFGSQYKVLLDLLGDLFNVIFFCGVFVEIQ